MMELWRLATARARGGRGGRRGRPDPFPPTRPRESRARMEPSHRGAANPCRVVRCPLLLPLPPRARRQLNRFSRILPGDVLKTLVEPPGVRLLGLGQRLEPLRQLAEALAARGLGHARIHLGVFVRLAGDCRLEVLLGLADRLAGRRVAYFLQEIEMAEGVAGLGIRRVLEEAGDVGEALDVRQAREVEVPPVRLRLASERFLEILKALSALEAGHSSSCI